MLDYLWGIMLLAGVVWGLFNGRAELLTEGVLDGAKEAVSMSITMLGIMSAWTGIMNIAQKSGMIESISRKLRPFMRLMFPDVREETPEYNHICTNIVANVLGLGWAATPAGLKAMEALAKAKNSVGKWAQDTADDNMCTFLVLNISSLQLIPVNVIAYRSQYGSVNPAAVIVPAIIATAVSTIAAICICRIFSRKKDKNA